VAKKSSPWVKKVQRQKRTGADNPFTLRAKGNGPAKKASPWSSRISGAVQRERESVERMLADCEARYYEAIEAEEKVWKKLSPLDREGKRDSRKFEELHAEWQAASNKVVHEYDRLQGVIATNRRLREQELQAA